MIRGIALIGFLALTLFGWGSNVYKLYNHSEQMETGQIVIRGIGLPVVPLGAVMGYVNV
jgi:hypothetical protein